MASRLPHKNPFLLILIGLLIAGCSAPPLGTGQLAIATTDITAADGVAVVPLRPLPNTGYPTLEMRLGKTVGRFVLDTGGRDAIVATPRFLDRAGWSTHGRAVRVGDSTYRHRTLRRVYVGEGLVIHDAPTVIAPLDNLIAASDRRQVAGLLTMAPLAGLELDIDLPANELRLRSADHGATPPKTAGFTAMDVPRPPTPRDDVRPYAVLHINGRAVPALLDTGSYDAVAIPQAVFEQTGAVLRDERASWGTSGFGTVAVRSRRGVIDELGLGPIVLRDARVHVVPTDKPGEPVVVGWPVLRHYRMIYHVPQRRLRLIGPDELTGPAPNEAVVRYLEAINANP